VAEAVGTAGGVVDHKPLAAAFNAVGNALCGTLEDAPTTSAVRRVKQTDTAWNLRLSWHALGE
jgi:hypothetical protein